MPGKMNIPGLKQLIENMARIHPRIVWGTAALLVLIGIGCLRIWVNTGPHKAAAAISSQSNPPADKRETTVQAHPNSEPFIAWSRGPVSPVTRNIFYINLDRFPQDGSKPAVPGGPVSGIANEGFWDRLAKSGALRAEDQDSHSQSVGSLQWQAAQLHLQSILMGPTPKVMVDGRLLNEGEVVAGFRVVKITARGILLEREGSKFEVAFK